MTTVWQQHNRTFLLLRRVKRRRAKYGWDDTILSFVVNIVLRNCLKIKQQQQDIIKQQAAQEIAELKEKHAAEMAAMKEQMERLKDEAARARVCNIRLMREAQSLREQFGYD